MRAFRSLPRNLSLRPRIQTISTQRSSLCTKPATQTHHAAPPPPPPPPPPQGSNNGLWILLVAAAAGGGYYFKEDIAKQLGYSSTSEPRDPVTDGTIKEEVHALEQRLHAAEPTTTPENKAPESKGSTAADKSADQPTSTKKDVNWDEVRADIVSLLETQGEGYDDGSYGPVLVRLGWHNAGTYDKHTKKGGSEGAAMRFAPEAAWGANAGLDVARAVLEPIKAKHPQATYSDLWSFAATVALEEMSGGELKFKWRPGRRDCVVGENLLPDGLLPDADGRSFKETPQEHVREIFSRMGFNDQEMVALSGAHALGRCHEDRSGYWGPWTYAPTTMSNEYFRLLLEETWSKKKTHKGGEWKGPEQYESKDGELMMLPTDMSLVWDEKFKKYVEQYAKDEQKFFRDFEKAWMKLQENGVKQFGWRKYYLFGPRQ